jgi:hypothetical protein
MNPFRTLFFIFFIANTYTIAKADEDDFVEALIDFADGMAVAACEANKECNAMMTAITVPIIIIYITCLCLGGIDPDDHEHPSTKRVVRTGTGYLVGRQIF